MMAKTRFVCVKPTIMSSIRKIAYTLAALISTWNLSIGRAQEVAPPSGSDSTNLYSQLPEVIVTAQKEPAELQSLPLSDTAVTRQTLDSAGVRYVHDAAVYAPNVFINEFSARKLSN